MGRQIRVVHRTGYHYAEQVSASHNEARMTPRNNREQFVLAAMVDISPTAWTHTYADYWGTTVTAFEISHPHRELDVVATSTVDVGDRAGVGPGVSWAELSDPNFRDQRCEMLEICEHVAPVPALRKLARGFADKHESPRDAAVAVMKAIRERIDYRPGVTQVHTSAEAVWEARAGVCQDIVHTAVGALRCMGIPARYVSGYVIPAKSPEPGRAYVGESHAWLQFWDGAWVGFDPTNGQPPGDLHVEVAVGRTYFDVPPLKGIYTGQGESEMFVEVEMTVLA
ncbi:MAG: transglutaminase family protein [Propionibacteriaceae bacterium]|jgi:transglutaminase-like putative cysteine protease|nr:transglutaminase family protein [Propionibacteriaceae bacterium]